MYMNYVSPVERYGFEDEETRRKREEELRKRLGDTEVGSTTEKTYMDGSKTITQTREVPGNAQAMRPVMPIQPTSPDDFMRIRQIESNNRDFTPQGVPVTSPKGAMFASQVMPTTAQQPGFGIRPAQSQTPEEYNRVGQEYFQAMRNRYNDDTIAAAAYNAGPGRVDQALRQAQQTGQPYTNFLPQETQQYIQKFNVARQQQQPQQQAMRPPAIQGARPLAMPSVGAGAEGVEGEQVAQQRMMDYTNRFQQAQNDVNQLLALREDTTAPSFIQDIARDRAYELLTTEKNKLAAQREVNNLVQSGDSKKIASVLSSEPDDEKGSYLKLLLLGFVSPDAARVEAQKLGIVPTKYESAVITNSDGTTKAVQVKVRNDGKVTGGFDFQGNPLSSEDLSKAISQTTGKNVTTGAEAYRDSTTGKIYYRQNDQRGNIFFTEPGGARYGGDTSKLQRVTDVSALQRIDYQTTSDLFKKHQGNISEVVKEYGIKLGRPLTGEEYQQVVQMVGPGTSRPTAQAPAQPAIPQAQAQVAQPQAQAQPATPQPTTTVAPTQQGAGVSTTPLPTLGSLERAGTIATAAQKQFVEKTVPTIAEDANNARQVAGTRREQLDIIRTNPSILDIYNGSGSGYDQARNVITKIVTGVYNADNQDQLFKDIKNISIQPNERAALEQFANLNMTVNPKTLRANAGPGAVSNAEQQANQKANIQNVAELTPLAALQGIYRSKFMSELSDAKEAFLSKNQDTYKTDADFNRAWAKEQNKWFKAHEAIAQARAEYLKPFNPGPSASKQELNAFRDKVFKAFELYPSPTFDTSRGWSYGTKNAEREIVKKWRESGALK